MKKRFRNVPTAYLMLTVFIGAFVILNLVYLHKISNSVELISEATLTTGDKYHQLKSDLKDEKRRMAFMAHVVDIKNILDQISTNTGSYSTMDFAYLIAKESFNNDLDPLLVLAVIKTESSFRKTAVSHKGAMGLMQILPDTAYYVSDMNDHIDLTDAQELFEPNTNILIGINYLSYLIEKFDNQKYAIIAYNMGPSGLIRRIKNGEDLPLTYYRTVMKNYRQILNISGRA